MKKIPSLFILLFLCISIYAQKLKTFNDFSVITIAGDTISLSKYKGKKLLVVNTASRCGFTPQYKLLEELYKKYKSYNFEILGFPCNDFMSQEPGSNEEINKFCTNNYGVTFQMMSKVNIVKGDTVPVYKWLQQKNLNGVETVRVNWNFNKFLIDEKGNWIRHYTSKTLPTDTSIVNWILKP